MKKLYFLSFFFLGIVPLQAQNNQVSVGAESITIPELRDHMFYLASDELEGRMPGTPGFEKALQYVVTQLRQAGLSPVCKTNDSKLSYYQNLTINRYSPGSNNRITIIKNGDKRTFSYEDNFIICYGGPFETKELNAGLVYVGAGIKEADYGIDDYKNIDIKGKWAVVLQNVPVYVKKKLPVEILKKYVYPPEGIKRIVQQAKDAGAIGIILLPDDRQLKRWKTIAEAYHDFYSIPGTGQIWTNTILPTVIIDSAMIEYLFTGQKYNPLTDKKSYKSFELKKCELTLREEYNSTTIHTANVIGLIVGSDPVLKNEFIILTAHLDHMGVEKGEVFNGADDNASGSVGVLEIAEALAKSKPERSIICMLCAGEELGLLGSYYFTENPPVPLKNIIVNVNLDMIGCSNTGIKGLAPIGAGRISTKLKEVILKVYNENQYVPVDWLYADTCRFINSSDHYSFHLKKIPAVFFFSGDNPDIHTPSDDPEKIDYEFFQRSCRLIYEVIMELANGDGLKE
jgi:hypothetical protein